MSQCTAYLFILFMFSISCTLCCNDLFSFEILLLLLCLDDFYGFNFVPISLIKLETVLVDGVDKALLSRIFSHLHNTVY